MRNFRFTLEKVLSWRSTELQREEARLGVLFAERSRLEGAHAEIRAARERTESRVRSAGSVDGSELAALAGYRVRVEKQLIEIERQRAQCGDQIARQRTRVVDAQRRLRLLEKLRSRRFEEWRTAFQRE